MTAALAAGSLLGLQGTAAFADETTETADHIVINQVYGGSEDGYADYSFIELYNPTGEDVSLEGWSVQYKSSSAGGQDDEWNVLKLSGTICSEDYYLIRCAAVTDTSNVTYNVPEGDIEWSEMVLYNKGLSVALVESTDQLTESFAGDALTAGISYVDLAAVQGNDEKDTQTPPAYETAYSAIQSKKNAIRRTDYIDTDDNSADFTAVNYSKTVSDDDGPHHSTKTASDTDTGDDSDDSDSSGSGSGDGDSTDTGSGDDDSSDSGSGDSDSSDTGSGDSDSSDTGSDDGDSSDSGSDEDTSASYTAVVTSNTLYQGFANGTTDLSATLIARYNSGAMSADGGSCEIVAYNSTNGYAYSVNGVKGVIDMVSLSDVSADVESVTDLSGSEIDVSALVAGLDESFTYGDMTSIALSPDETTLAVALQDEDYTKSGRVVFFTCNTDGSLTCTGMAQTGVQPDMVTYNEDGTKVLTADEGEPREGYTAEGAEDPMGTVTVIDTESLTAQVLDFTSYDADPSALTDDGIIIKTDTNPSVDLEPEYISVSGGYAYIALQENNAIAILDLSSNTFTGIYSVGYEDYSEVAVDLDGSDGTYSPSTYANIRGIRMPDGITTVTIGEDTYLLTANEGDSRAWGDESGENCNENKSKTSAVNGYSFGKKVTWFDTTYYSGLDSTMDYVFGGRSFTMFKVTDSGLEEVYDSGSDFEALTAEYLADYFNCSNDSIEVEDRSGKKGTEPESVKTGTIGSKTYAFIALERIGGVMIYDITDPSDVTYVNYINSRDFSADILDDVSPEGLYFISGDDSSAMLLTANEVSGTLGVIALTYACVHSDLQHVEAAQASCTETGNIEYWYCADCRKYFSDEACTDAISEDDTVTEAAGHSYGDLTWIWEDDYSGAVVSRTCSVCGETQSADAVITSTVTTEATTEASGVRTYTAAAQLDETTYYDTIGVEIPQLSAQDSENSGDSDNTDTEDSNTGDSDTDDSNTDDSNTGDSNADDSNTGDSDTNDSNTDDLNTDDSDTNDSNDDDSTTSDSNADDANTDDSNADDSNTDDSNADDSDTDDSNTGDSDTDDANNQGTDSSQNGSNSSEGSTSAITGGQTDGNTSVLKKQTIKVKKSSLKKTLRYKKLKKKKQTFRLKASSSGNGKITYKKLSGNKKIRISSKGKVTVKKGLKKGKTYKVKVRVTAAATSTYAKEAVTVTLKVKVK